MSRLSDRQPGQRSEPTLIEADRGRGGQAHAVREPLEDWLLRSENVRAIAFYVAAMVAITATGWALTVVGVSWWVILAAIVIVSLGLPVALVTRSWRRPSFAAGVTVGALALGSAAYMVLGAYGVGPGASLLAAGKLRPGERILVADFGARGADSTLGTAAATAVRVSLAQSPSVRVLSPAAVASYARSVQARGSGVTLPLARRIAVRQGIRTLVDGEIAAVGGGLVVTLRVMAADTAIELASVRDALAGPDELIPAVDRLSRELRKKIGEPLRSVRASVPLERVTTASLPALRLYSDALRLIDFERRPAPAVALLRNAIALDSGFAMARRRLADALYASGAAAAGLDSALDGAYAFRHRLIEGEQLQLDAAYFSLSSKRDRGRAVKAMEALLARGDTTAQTLGSLAHLLASRREYARAESLGAAAVALAPDEAGSHEPLLIALAAQSKMTKLQAAVDSLHRDYPQHWYAAVAPVAALYANGDDDLALAKAESLRASPDVSVQVYAASFAARLDLLHGRVLPYQRSYTEAAGVRPVSTSRALADSALFAFHDAWYLGQNDRATQRLDSALSALPLDAIPVPDRPYLRLATVYAMAGKPARAREILARLAAAPLDTALTRQRQPELHRALGEVALAEGRPRLAIVEFYRADSLIDGPTGDPLQTMVDLGRAFNDANEPDSAIVWLEQFVNAPRWQRDSIDAIYLPRVHELLAELYDMKGDEPRAISHYGRFVNLWRNADKALLPVVAGARRRLNELSREARP